MQSHDEAISTAMRNLAAALSKVAETIKAFMGQFRAAMARLCRKLLPILRRYSGGYEPYLVLVAASREVRRRPTLEYPDVLWMTTDRQGIRFGGGP